MGNARLERDYKPRLIKRIEAMFPNCYILHNDSGSRQGVPDLLILYKNKWAMLETKRATRSARRPNQEYYVHIFDMMSFAAFIYPENEEEVLSDLQRAFEPDRTTRVSQR